MPVRPDRETYGVLKKYVRTIEEVGQRVNVIRPGEFYAFNYFIDRTMDPSIIRFYDLMPLVFVFDKRKVAPKVKKGKTKPNSKIMYSGLNFHHLPIQPRKLWLARMGKIRKDMFEQDVRILPMADYDRLYRMYMKASQFSVRQYDHKRIRRLFRIPTDKLPDLMNFYARTYYGIGIPIVESNYTRFRVTPR